MTAAVSVFFESNPISLRALGAMERFLWLIDQHRPIHFSVAMEVSGATTPGQWRRALNRVQKRHPLLSTSIRLNQEGWPEFCFDGDRPIPLVVQYGQLESWVRVLESELGQRFNPDDVPLARAVLLYEPQRAFVVLTFHHAIADGMSGVYILRDMLRVLAGEEIADLPMPEPTEEWVRRSGIPEAAAAATNGGAVPQPPNRFRFEDGRDPLVDAHELPRELSAAVRARARTEQTTVHGALSAALFLAGRELSVPWAQNPVRTLCPVDLRRRLPLGDVCGFHSPSVPAILDAAQGDGFWDIARLATGQIQPALTAEAMVRRIHAVAPILSGMDFETSGSFIRNALAHESVLTNLGELPCDRRVGHLRVEAIWGPAIVTGVEDEQVLGVASLRGGGICLLHSSFTPFPGLLQRMESLLAEASAA
jgi:NRPS condensation-like uncharacterized protein